MKLCARYKQRTMEPMLSSAERASTCLSTGFASTAGEAGFSLSGALSLGEL